MAISAGARAGDLLHVDLRDVARFRADVLPEAQVILNDMANRPATYFPESVTLATAGPGISRIAPRTSSVRKTLVNSVYGVEIFNPVSPTAEGLDFDIRALIHSKKQTPAFLFREYRIRVGGSPRGVLSVQVLRDFPLSDTEFSVDVSLVARKAVFKDSRQGVVKVYPLGVGAFDEGVTASSNGKTVLMTPTYSGATLSRAAAIRSRSDPAYYAGMPFVRIVRRDGHWSPIAFHIVQHAHEAPGGRDYNHLLRAFDSHGCMRVREKDLYELYYLLLGHSLTTAAVEMSYWLDDDREHPFPLDDSFHQRVKNFGTVARPAIRRDEHRLTITEVIREAPPIERLAGAPLDGDKMTRLEMVRYHADDTELKGAFKDFELAPAMPELDELLGEDL